MTAPLRKLGRYELLRRLALGGMGEIYLARARGAAGFEKSVIIKTILPHLAEEEEFVTKFLDEGRIVVQLTHGNIVPVFDMGQDDGEYFIAMEYVHGLDLRDLLRRLKARNAELPLEAAIYIAGEVCKGLSYAHRKTGENGQPLGIVHRDVSPSNVLISKEGEVKIIDFGIAHAADKFSQTKSGAIQGKCCYMSPEQARGGSLDARSDIFSTAVLLYEMLTLIRPFEGRNDLESLDLVRRCEFDPPGILRPEISEELDEIILKAMAPDPDERYQTIDELYVDLQQELFRQGFTVTSQHLVQALGEVFDDDAADLLPQGRPANLDEALAMELALLEDSTSTPAPALSDNHLGLAPTRTAAAQGTQTIGPRTPATVQLPSPAKIAPEAPAPAEEPGAETEAEAEIESAEDEASPESALPTSEPPRKTQRPLFIALAALFFLALAIFALTRFNSLPAPATLTLETDPPGAQIHLDGEELVGRKTPSTLTLEPGEYSLDIILEEYQPRRIRVDLEPGQVIDLGPDELRLTPQTKPPRQFTIKTDPPRAIISADSEEIGSSPQTVLVPEGEILNISAHADDCSPAFYSLSYSHQRENITLILRCDTPTEAQAAAEQRTLPSESIRKNLISANSAHRRILINSIPEGARIRINQEDLGQTPIYAHFPPDEQLLIEANHDGFRPLRRVTRPRDLNDGRLELRLEEEATGCLTFRPIFPANNEIAINGKWLPGRHMALRDHRLPAGENSITLRHPESGKEETFTVSIEPGDHCKHLVVWERDEP